MKIHIVIGPDQDHNQWLANGIAPLVGEVKDQLVAVRSPRKVANHIMRWLAQNYPLGEAEPTGAEIYTCRDKAGHAAKGTPRKVVTVQAEDVIDVLARRVLDGYIIERGVVLAQQGPGWTAYYWHGLDYGLWSLDVTERYEGHVMGDPLHYEHLYLRPQVELANMRDLWQEDRALYGRIEAKIERCKELAQASDA